MKVLVEILAAALGMVKAEARQLKHEATSVAGGLLLLKAATTVMLGGLGLLAACMFIAISCALGPALAALLSGATLLLVGLILAGLAKWSIDRSGSR